MPAAAVQPRRQKSARGLRATCSRPLRRLLPSGSGDDARDHDDLVRAVRISVISRCISLARSCGVARFFRRGFLLRTARMPATPPQDPKEESSPRQDPPAHNRF